MNHYFADQALVKAPPVRRAAYSDRTAWLMAELSRLVYEPLPNEQRLEKLVEEVVAAVKGGEEGEVPALIHQALALEAGTLGDTPSRLQGGGFEFIDSFAVDGSEAMLVQIPPRSDFPGILVLIFRGTQMTVDDIRSDIKANLVPAPGGGRVHCGFLEAYQKIEQPIREAIEPFTGMPVYITGHSLGGALAMVATRYLESDSTGATYTYGCPRVADDEFYRRIKTPVYRVVNAADSVPRVPFGFGLNLLLVPLRLLPFKSTFTLSNWLRRYFSGYTHYGDLVFLSVADNSPDEQGIAFKDLEVRHSPNYFWELNMVTRHLIASRGRAAVNDHRIADYSQKLLANAQRRAS